ncbi:MAG: hypothetical protein OEZ32_11550 [Nitrospinota bacterium]|nr:hypothetical protein [Nitrospinota bacterium]
MAPFRVIVLWSLFAVGILYLAYFNSDAWVPFYISPELSMELPVMAPVLAAFFLGALCVAILYSVESVSGFFSSIRKSAEEKRMRRATTLYDTGMERLTTGQRKEGEKFFTKALGLNGEHIPSLLALGIIRREEGDLTEAINLHSRAKGLNEKSAAAMLELAEDYFRAEQFVYAVSTIKEAQKIVRKSLPAMRRIRDVYIRVGNIEEAISAQRAVIDNSPVAMEKEERNKLAGLIYQKAMELVEAGKLEEARDALSRAIYDDNQFIPAYIKLAEVYEKLGKSRNARKTLESGFKATRSIIPLKTLELYLRAKDENTAVVDTYRWAKGMAPENEEIRILLVGAYLHNGLPDTARLELSEIKGPLAGSTLAQLMEGKIIHHGDTSDNPAIQALEKAYQREMNVFFRFTCGSCCAITPEYSGRCPSCGQWGSVGQLLL